MPALGYFGPDDVCLGQWAHELLLVLRKLSAGNDARHVYDEGEQGQPVFEFRRDESHAYISITGAEDDEDEDEQGASDWRAVACDVGALLSSVRSFLDELRRRLESLAPRAATAWWARNIERDADTRKIRVVIKDAMAFWSDDFGSFVSNDSSATEHTTVLEVPAAWIAGDALVDGKLEAIYAHLYGASWRQGNDDGSRYEVLDCRVDVLPPGDPTEAKSALAVFADCPAMRDAAGAGGHRRDHDGGEVAHRHHPGRQ
jgi:hypothetical protein